MIHYEPMVVHSMENNGWSVTFHCETKSSIEWNGEMFKLEQFHFHSQSEHTIEGKRFPLEMHLVHKSNEGKLLVLGILFDNEVYNPILGELWKDPPDIYHKKKTSLEIDVSQLIDLDQGFFFYEGSLTTPPFTEGVVWILQNKIAMVSEAQVDAYRAIFRKETYRELQPASSNSVVFPEWIDQRPFNS